MKAITKSKLKDFFAAVALFSIFLVVGTIDYYDEVDAHNVNCSNAIYANDNINECGE